MFGNFAGTKDWTKSWPAKRQKIADGLERIRHWDIRLGNYYQIANYEATWFIDPPIKESMVTTTDFNTTMISQFGVNPDGGRLSFANGKEPTGFHSDQ